MIAKELITINNRNFIRQYSDENRYLIRDNARYTEAIDPEGIDREYTEGDYIEVVKPSEEDIELLKEKAAAYDRITGVSELNK